jgi:hypothetical protein
MMDDDECGAISGMIDRRKEVLGGNRPQCCFVHKKFHII